MRRFEYISAVALFASTSGSPPVLAGLHRAALRPFQKPSYQQQVCSSASPKALISIGIAQHHSQRPEYRRVVRSMTPAAHQSNAPPWLRRQITHFLDGNLCLLPALD